MNLNEYFENLNYTFSQDTNTYLEGLNEVDLKLLIKRVCESNDFVKKELSKQVKLTQYKNIQEVITSLDKKETKEFVYWLAENVFGTKQIIEEQLEKILIKE